jgi:hypothetical protein
MTLKQASFVLIFVAFNASAGISMTPANRIGKPKPPKELRSEDLLGLLPDAKLSPGAIDAKRGPKQICSGTTKSQRTTTDATKKQVWQAYLDKYPEYAELVKADYEHGKTTKGGKHEPLFEVDHIVSLELGGADVPANLYPEPFQHEIAGAADKDRVEHAAKPEMCAILKEQGLKAAQTYLKKIQATIRGGFTRSANGRLVAPARTWYTLYYNDVLPHLDSDGNMKKGEHVVFAND